MGGRFHGKSKRRGCLLSKLDLTKAYKPFFTAKKDPELLDVPPANYLMISGRGAPGSEIYQAKVSALFGVAYPLKFKAKSMGNDYAVSKLEGLWWFDTYDGPTPPREEWNWTMMIRQPDFITPEMAEGVKQEVFAKKGTPEIDEVSFETLHEGLSAQIMHLGPYSAEEPTIQTLHEFVYQQGYILRGKHHEVYLKDPLKSDPEKLQTIIRHPVEKAS